VTSISPTCRPVDDHPDQLVERHARQFGAADRRRMHFLGEIPSTLEASHRLVLHLKRHERRLSEPAGRLPPATFARMRGSRRNRGSAAAGRASD
jgi:hypothetical protein